MRAPTPTQAAHRRRVLVWTPLAVLATLLWLGTYPLANGATALGFLLLMVAAVSIVVDDGEGRAEA